MNIVIITIAIFDPWSQIFFFKNIMTLELCMTSLYKVNQKRKYRTAIFYATNFGRGRLWLVEKK